LVFLKKNRHEELVGYSSQSRVGGSKWSLKTG